MGKWYAMVLIVGMILILLGCSTTKSAERELNQNLTAEEHLRISTYREGKEGLMVDTLRIPEANEEKWSFLNAYKTYEGALLLRYIGLRSILDNDQAEQFIRAVFEGIPQKNPVGSPIRNVVVSSWYNSGKPLVLHITTAFTGSQEKRFPALVVLLNAQRGVLSRFGHKVAREMEPHYAYPWLVKKENRISAVEADGVYVFTVYGERISSSSDNNPPPNQKLEDIQDILERVNMTDTYLRDADPKNDHLVLPVLEEVRQNEGNKPLHRLHAGVQLFIYYLFQGEEEKTEQIAKELQASPLLSDPTVAESDLASIILEDLDFIITMNRRLRR